MMEKKNEKVTNSGLTEMQRSNGIICFKLMYYEEALKLSQLKGNRNINPSHVDDFIKILKNTTFDKNNNIAFRTSMIVINEKNSHIIDGQHRHAAFIKAIEDGIIPSDSCIIVCPMYYKTIKDEFNAVQSHNEKTKNWTLNDYITAYTTQSDDYKKLERFCEEHELCHNKSGRLQFSYGIAIIGATDRNTVKYGGLKVTDDDLAIAHNIHEELVAIRHRFGLGNDYTIVPMAQKWKEFRNKFSMKDIKRWELPDKILRLPKKNKQDWEVVFSTLYQYYERKH